MRWEPVAAPDITQDLILFDGDCVLCSRGAHFVHARDRAGRFKFVAIQSAYGRQLAQRFGIDTEAPATNLAVIDGSAFFKSDAALNVLHAMSVWRWTNMARVLPRPLRNWIYDRIARNRYSWFGRKEQCWAGNPAFRDRILERAP
jgi:predicted DCC family thiol-disulfide oxidoreductase YuxK